MRCVKYSKSGKRDLNMMSDYESGGGETLLGPAVCRRPGQNGASEQNTNLVGLTHDFEDMLSALANNCKEKGCLPG